MKDGKILLPDLYKADKRIRLLLVGGGEHATTVLHTAITLIDEINVVGCCDLNQERASFCARRFGLSVYYLDLDKMLRETKADAALVVVFPGIQAELTKKCLNAGVHVFTEKPLALTIDEALTVKETSEKTQCLVGVDFNRRFAPAYVQMKEVIDLSIFGKPSLFEAKFLGGYRPNDQDLLKIGAIHFFDIARYLLGEIKEVFAYKYRKEQGKQTYSVNFIFENGCVGSFLLGSLGYWTSKGVEFLEIRGDQNSISVDNCREIRWQKPPQETYRNSEGQTQTMVEIPTPAAVSEPNYGNVSRLSMNSFYLQGYHQIIREFAISLLENKRRIPGVDDGIMALRIALAIEESVEKKKPVSINYQD